MKPEAYCLHKTFEPAESASFTVDRHYLLYALEGTIRLEAEGKRWTLPPARAAFIRANEPITITILSKLVSASVLFAPGFINPPERALTVFEMSPLGRELVRECRSWECGCGQLPPHAKRLFKTLADIAHQLSQVPSRACLPLPKSKQMQKALNLTEALAQESPTFEMIAASSNQSTRAMARRFSNEMSMTWREVLRHVRIVKASEQLAMTSNSIQEIAYSVGYKSISGFNAAFRQQMGMTPSEYRESLIS